MILFFKNRMKKYRIIILLLSAFGLFGCNAGKDDVPWPNPWTPTTDTVDKVLVMYLMGSNNLSGYLSDNVNQALAAVSDGSTGDGRIIVFHDTYSGTTLSELVYEKSEAAAKRMTLKDYGNLDCTDSTVIAAVMNDIKSIAPARHYAITLGSHGWGWLPNSLGTNRVNRSAAVYNMDWIRQKAVAPCDEYSTRNMGTDGSQWIDVSSLAWGLSGIHFDFMMLDACFMASVEALYDLRFTADYIMSSPCEVMGQGFPYESIVRRMFADWGAWNSIADCYVDYYNTAYMNSAYASIVKTSELDDLASAFGGIVLSGLTSQTDTEQIQHYEQLDSHIFYDLMDYVAGMRCQDAGLVEDFRRCLDDCVVYVRNTERIWSKIYSFGEWIELRAACGLSSYIPQEQYPVFRQAYMQTAWGRRVYGND